ncbi:MAG: hypothetical protein R3337_07395 [Gammaproteobacteria bacterium]|nr:hypothetical protein [Gammaproteobacteria bacterium]
MTRTGAWLSVSHALLGLVLVVVGVLLLNEAFDSMTVGRPITRAWVTAVAGLMLSLSGIVLTILRALELIDRVKKRRSIAK